MGAQVRGIPQTRGHPSGAAVAVAGQATTAARLVVAVGRAVRVLAVRAVVEVVGLLPVVQVADEVRWAVTEVLLAAQTHDPVAPAVQQVITSLVIRS